MDRLPRSDLEARSFLYCKRPLAVTYRIYRIRTEIQRDNTACMYIFSIDITVYFDFQGLRLPTLKLVLKPTHTGRPRSSTYLYVSLFFVFIFDGF